MHQDELDYVPRVKLLASTCHTRGMHSSAVQGALSAFTRPSCDNTALLLLERKTPATWAQSPFRWPGPRHEPLSSSRILTSCLIGKDMHVSAS